jgi:hypothetical protein
LPRCVGRASTDPAGHARARHPCDRTAGASVPRCHGAGQLEIAQRSPSRNSSRREPSGQGSAFAAEPAPAGSTGASPVCVGWAQRQALLIARRGSEREHPRLGRAYAPPFTGAGQSNQPRHSLTSEPGLVDVYTRVRPASRGAPGPHLRGRASAASWWATCGQSDRRRRRRWPRHESGWSKGSVAAPGAPARQRHRLVGQPRRGSVGIANGAVAQRHHRRPDWPSTQRPELPRLVGRRRVSRARGRHGHHQARRRAGPPGLRRMFFEQRHQGHARARGGPDRGLASHRALARLGRAAEHALIRSETWARAATRAGAGSARSP